MKTIRILFSLLLLAACLPLAAQAAPEAGDASDVKVHKFQPRVSPRSLAPAQTTTDAKTGLSTNALAQIAAIEAEKKSRTPAQRKIDSRVLHTIRMLQNKPVTEGVPYLETGVDLDDDNNLLIDILGDIDADFLSRLKALGGRIVTSTPQYKSVRAFVPAGQIEALAALAGVRHISPQRHGTVNRSMALRNDADTQPGLEERTTRIRSFLTTAIPNFATPDSTSAFDPLLAILDSEGDAAHKANLARSTFGVSGAGLKIGVLSDSVLNLASSQQLGRLGEVIVLPGQAGGSDGEDEGTAMLEIVHDLAPGARLYFATACCAGVTPESFAQNIRALRAAGCDIIIDDISFFNESPFQDGQDPSTYPSGTTSNGGVIAQAVNDVVADGAIYFSSAANSGNLSWGTSGTWEGDFVDGGPVAGVIATSGESGTVHAFNATNTYDTLAAGTAYVDLFWSDPLGGSGNDYDLFVLDSTGTTVVASSANLQTGTQDPWEEVSSGSGFAANDRIVVVKHAGLGRFLHLATNRGELAIQTRGEVHGHNATISGYSVAATWAYQPFYSGVPIGPYPAPFNANNLTEPFSSDGPRQIFFHADGTAVTPGNFSSTGGHVYQKPDITAADGVSIVPWGGFSSPFYGTSAAAPHAGAIAALVKSAKPTITNDQVRSALSSTAINLSATGLLPQDFGAGIVMAYEAIVSLGAPSFANPDLGTVTATENPGNGDGYISAGEGGRLVIELQNKGGGAAATAISATLTTTTPGVTITRPNTSAYADLSAGGSGSVNLTPFTFTLASDFPPCGMPIEFTLTVTYSGGPSATRELTFSVPGGQPPLSIDGALGATPASLPGGLTYATGLQTGRISRNGLGSTCSTGTKTWPGAASTTGSRAFDSFTFTACRNICALVEMNPTPLSHVNLFSAAYSPSFAPGSIGTNYIGDGGQSNGPEAYSLNVTTGQIYTVVVHSVPTDASGGVVGTQYNLKISGCALNCSTPNQVPVARAKDVTATAGPGGTASASVDNGSYDPDGDPITITQVPPGPYGVGDTTVLLTVTDNKGATSQASAVVTVVRMADLAIQLTHSGNFAPGQTGSTYTMTVSNIGISPTAGTVTVTDTLPTGLTATGLTGTGWSCTLATLTCTRSDALAAGASYTPLTLTVTVAVNAPVNLVNSATVSGGGESNPANDTSSDPTTVVYQPIRILVAPPVYYPTIQSASTNVSAGGTIQLQAQTFTEAVTLTNPLAYTITGGYDAGFVTVSGYSTVSSLTIQYGTVAVGNIVIH